MFGSAVEEMKAMRGMSAAVSSMYSSKLSREGCTEDELRVRDAGLVHKPEAAAYFLEGITALEALEREYAKLTPPNAAHTLAPSPVAPLGRVVVLEVPGGKDKREDGHRPDTVPILNACIANGFAATPRFYMDATAPAIARDCARADVVVVRIPTDKDIPGVTRDKLRAILAQVNEAHGTVILPRAIASDVMNRKDALVKLAASAMTTADGAGGAGGAGGGSSATLACAAGDTVAYTSVAEFRRLFPASLVRAAATAAKAKRIAVGQGSKLESEVEVAAARRVLKQDRDAERAGYGDGNGVWCVELLSKGKMNKLQRMQHEEAYEAGQTYEYSIGPDGDGIGPLGAVTREASVAFGGGGGRVGVPDWEVGEALTAESGDLEVSVNSVVECTHALDNQTRRFTLGHFMLVFEKYLTHGHSGSGGGGGLGGGGGGGGGGGRYLVDQAYAPAISTRGEVRVDYVFDTPLEIMVSKPAEGGLGGTLPSGASHERFGADNVRFKPLLEGFGRRDIHRLMPALGLPPGSPLPMFWSVDFISTDTGSATASAAADGDGGDYGYVMTGLRCAVSGTVVRGMEAMDPTILASLVGRALRALVPLPYARAEARGEAEAARERMAREMEEQRRAFEEERRKMEEEKQKMEERKQKLESTSVTAGVIQYS